MLASSGLIYEVTLTIERDIIDSFDGWLANHVEEMLAIPGFISANVFALDDDDSGQVKRVTQYFLDSEGDLESYLVDQATAMRQSAIDRFGEQFSATRRILRETDIADGHIVPIENCLNCGTALSGQYCGNCGQRSRSRLISIWELLSDAFGDLFELDSRIWKTLIPLLVRPGKLTYEYLLGRRARFMPPFRTYLVLSIVFFLVAFFNPQEDFGILFEPPQEAPQQTSEAGSTTDAPGNEVIDELIAEGIIPPDGTTDSCELESMDMQAMPDWLARRLTRERAQIVCERVSADNGAALLDKLKDNIPAALFLLLPLMAFVLKVLYPLSKRYYVEHLLFVVHYHAFFFLILILQMLFSRLGSLLRLPDGVVGTTLVATSLYVPVYLYKAMRRVYAQGHAATVPKFLGLAIAYFIGLAAILGFAALFAAFSI
jgi:Protein of unknown function (DUF3667)/Domain of unknown function (DUF4286)